MGAAITFLFTSKDRVVTKIFVDVPHEDMNKVSVFCTYNINNVNRHTEIDVGKQSISSFIMDNFKFDHGKK
jgi:hypothetical protein